MFLTYCVPVNSCSCLLSLVLLLPWFFLTTISPTLDCDPFYFSPCFAHMQKQIQVVKSYPTRSFHLSALMVPRSGAGPWTPAPDHQRLAQPGRVRCWQPHAPFPGGNCPPGAGAEGAQRLAPAPCCTDAKQPWGPEGGTASAGNTISLWLSRAWESCLGACLQSVACKLRVGLSSRRQRSEKVLHFNISSNFQKLLFSPKIGKNFPLQLCHPMGLS